MDSYGEDISRIIKLDEDRIQARLGLDTPQSATPSTSATATQPSSFYQLPNNQLSVIMEEDDYYPFDD